MGTTTVKADYHIEGMSCQHCIDAVEGALGGIDGVHVEEVGIGRARVTYEPNAVDPAQLEGAIEEAGYNVRSVDRIE
ncbi:MAG: heavy-metal-associated domain-containing protein [Rhodothermales bacterium]|nr:heavy-metal-associated domain-containing protein [Rhodothermales bacterium]